MPSCANAKNSFGFVLSLYRWFVCHFATHSCSDSGCCCPSISFSIIKILIEFLYYLVLATGDDLCGVFHMDG